MIKDILRALDQSVAKEIRIWDYNTDSEYICSSDLEEIYKAIPPDAVISKVTLDQGADKTLYSWEVYVKTAPIKVIRDKFDNLQVTASLYSNKTKRVMNITIEIDDISFSFDLEFSKRGVLGHCRVLEYCDNTNSVTKTLISTDNNDVDHLNIIYRMLNQDQIDGLNEFIETAKLYIRASITASYIKDTGSDDIEYALIGLLDIPYFRGLAGLHAWSWTMTDLLCIANPVMERKDAILIVRPDIDVSCPCTEGFDKAFLSDISTFIEPYENSEHELKHIVLKFLEQHKHVKYNAYVNIFTYAKLLIESYDDHAKHSDDSYEYQQNRVKIMNAIDTAL